MRTFAVLSLGFAPAPLPRPPSSKGDVKKMQGTWDLTWWGTDDTPLKREPKGCVVVIAGSRLTFYEDGRSASTWELRLDATREPKAVDLSGTGVERGEELRGRATPSRSVTPAGRGEAEGVGRGEAPGLPGDVGGAQALSGRPRYFPGRVYPAAHGDAQRLVIIGRRG